MGENIPLTSTTSETEGAYSPPSLFEHAPPAEHAEKHQHAEQWAQDGDIKITVSEHLLSHAVDSPPLKSKPQEKKAEARKSAAKIPHQSFDDSTAGGWNDFDKSSAIFNFNERPVRDAEWMFVFAVPLVVLFVAALHAFVYSLYESSGPLLISPSLYPVALILLFAFSLPLPMLIVSSLRKIPARVLSALLIFAAVICALQSATSAVHYYTTPALVPPNAADVAPVVYAPVRDGSSSDFSVNTDVAESAEGESEKTTDEMIEAAIEASEGGTEGRTEGGTEGGSEGGTEGAMGDYVDVQEDPSEAAHVAHWARAAHSAAHQHLQSHASDARKRARGRSLQGENRRDVALYYADLITRPLYFIAFVVLGLLSVVAMLLVLRCNHHLPLAASAVAHAAHTAIVQAQVIFFMPLPIMLAALFLGLPLMYSLEGDTSDILFVLLLPTSLFVVQVLSALLTYSTAAVFARLYVTTSGGSSRSSSEGRKAGEGEEGVTLRGQLELFSSAFSLACTSSLGTCCAVAITSCAATAAKLLLSSLFLALFGESILGCLLVALLHCTQIVIRFFLSCLVLPTAAMSGHGFTRSLRLSLDILQRFLAPIVTANAAGLALLTMLVVPIVIIYNIVGLIGKLEPEEGSDGAGLVGDESGISFADVKDTCPV
ncbi:unnamed protein product [Closterium sp. Naga37s-1]|nr:unnamed protein product [Closterium sp. Naga37s-1]